jgi:hypothetical protein
MGGRDRGALDTSQNHAKTMRKPCENLAKASRRPSDGYHADTRAPPRVPANNTGPAPGQPWTWITGGYSLITLKNWAVTVPGATLKVNEPVPALFVCSRVHWFSALAALVELNRAKGWLTGPVPEIVRALP